jgi:hypothetical protein
MTLKGKVQAWLGIQDFHADTEVAFNRIISKLDVCIANQRTLSLAIGRLVTVVDPMYATAEDDPARRAASDALGERVIRKLLSEHRLSNPTRIDDDKI